MSGRSTTTTGPLGPKPHPVLLRPPREFLPIEDRLALNHREIQVLRQDHQEMSSTHAAMKQDLSLADQELHQLAAAARKVREEREAQVKELYERSLAVEAEYRGIEAINEEYDSVIGDVHKLTEGKIELVAKLKAVDAELQRVKLQGSEVPAIKDDIECMRLELRKGRAAIEFEKKTRAANLDLHQAMEKEIVSKQREIERLRAELAHAEKRARAAAAAASNPSPGYMGDYGSPNTGLGGGPYSVHYTMHQGQISADGASPALYRPPASGHDPFGMH